MCATGSIGGSGVTRNLLNILRCCYNTHNSNIMLRQWVSGRVESQYAQLTYHLAYMKENKLKLSELLKRAAVKRPQTCTLVEEVNWKYLFSKTLILTILSRWNSTMAMHLHRPPRGCSYGFIPFIFFWVAESTGWTYTWSLYFYSVAVSTRWISSRIYTRDLYYFSNDTHRRPIIRYQCSRG